MKPQNTTEEPTIEELDESIEFMKKHPETYPIQEVVLKQRENLAIVKALEGILDGLEQLLYEPKEWIKSRGEAFLDEKGDKNELLQQGYEMTGAAYHDKGIVKSMKFIQSKIKELEEKDDTNNNS